jgi:hypothetical protein
MEINVAVVGDDANEGKERRKAMSLPDLTKKSIKSITVVDSIESVSVVVGEERKQRWEEGSVEREGWEEGKREEISRRLQFLFVLPQNKNPSFRFFKTCRWH